MTRSMMVSASPAIGAARRQAPQGAEMDIKWISAAAGDLNRHLHHPDAPAGEAADFRMPLDAAHQAAIGHRRAHRGIHIHAFGAVEVGIVKWPSRPPTR